ncbi:MAG: TetR/AcrR family transcriptional regulator [Pleurocapsa sp. MO_192.B19]|nr:TetR/AcrR family transcriptional regulator [Pleurocapsa sp. MO_192.B19]
MPKEKIISKLIPVFRHYGYEGATVSRLSAATGLKKASLYHHFQGGKEQMAEAVLEYISNWIEENVFAPLQSNKLPRDRILAMTKGIDKFYESGQTPCLLAVMSLGEADNLFHQQLEQSLKQWLDTLAQIVEETGVEPQQARQRAEDAMITIQGALVLVRVTKDTKVFQRAIANLPQILLPD